MIEEGFSFLGMSYSNVLSGKGKGKGATLPIFLRSGLDLFLSRFETKPPPPYVQRRERERKGVGGNERGIYRRVCQVFSL